MKTKRLYFAWELPTNMMPAEIKYDPKFEHKKYIWTASSAEVVIGKELVTTSSKTYLDVTTDGKLLTFGPLKSGIVYRSKRSAIAAIKRVCPNAKQIFFCHPGHLTTYLGKPVKCTA